MIKRSYGSIQVEAPPLKREGHTSKMSPRRTASLLTAVAVAIASLYLLTSRNGNSQIEQKKSKRPKVRVAHFFPQAVDHFDTTSTDTWTHRYYRQSKYFSGPGHPIILVIGGEGGNDYGMLFPFIYQQLASTFGAYVLHPEHRFYGPYVPTKETSTDILLKFLTPHQAMEDMISIIKHYQTKLGCSFERSSPDYCPIITIGGSYPGFLAACMRLLYPEVVDIGYGSSAPMKLFAGEADQFGYYDIVTSSAEKASPGCAAAVEDTLNKVDMDIRSNFDFTEVARKLNICRGSIPNYIESNDMFSKEIMQIIADHFADLNMFNYNKVQNQTRLAKTCYLFQNESLDAYGILADLWTRLDDVDQNLPCFDMTSQLADGHNATFSGADWSGIGSGKDGMMFDFQCCTALSPAVGFSEESMFPHRKFTLEWLTQHCLSRFNVVPKPYQLVYEWKFNDLVGQRASRILFTNGLNDMWSAGSYLEDISDSILTVNMPNGAHHSELSHANAQNLDTNDVRDAHDEIVDILSRWLDEVRSLQKP